MQGTVSIRLYKPLFNNWLCSESRISQIVIVDRNFPPSECRVMTQDGNVLENSATFLAQFRIFWEEDHRDTVVAI